MNGFSYILMASVMLSAHVSTNKRIARVINGELVIGRSTGYDAVRYFTAIGSLHGVANFRAWLFEIKGNFGVTFCGGALITPSIVQTACHCLSYKQKALSFPKLLPAKVKHSWEHSTRIYIGVNVEFGGEWSMEHVDPIIAKKFLVHEACARLPIGTRETVTNDYGWILVDPNWDPDGKLSRRVNYAPVYTKEEIEKTWIYLNSRRAVCLVVGFGPNVEGMQAENSKLRHGWLVLLFRPECVSQTSLNLPNLKLITWVCLVPIPKLEQRTAPGDSGGPVTCNNQYFAVHYGRSHVVRKHVETHNWIMNLESALYWAQFQNTVQFRNQFIRMMEDYGKIMADAALRRFDPLTSSVQTFNSTIHQISASNSSGGQHSCSFSIAFILIMNLIKFAGV